MNQVVEALHFCEIADYESAIRIVGWPPDLSSLDGEKLLLWGVCASQKSAAQQTNGGQELAKDCLTRSIELLANEHREIAQVQLALCCWRLGDLDDSLALLVSENYSSPRAQFDAHSVRAMLAIQEKNPEKALQLLGECERLLDYVSSIAQGKFHNHKALALALLSSRDRNEQFRDRAIIEFEAARFYWEEAPRLQGIALNNLARLYSLAGRFDAAHDCADRAIFHSRYDKSLQAECIDQKARLLLDEGRPREALVRVKEALLLVLNGEQQSVINECLDTLNRCTKPDVFTSLPKRIDIMVPDSRSLELAHTLTKYDDGEHAAELIELLARTSDQTKVRPILRHLVTQTEAFEEFFENYLKQFAPVDEVSERVS